MRGNIFSQSAVLSMGCRWSMLLHLDVCGASVLTPGRLGAVPCDLWPPSAGLQEPLVVPGRGEVEVADPWAGVRCRVGGQSGHCFSDEGPGRQHQVVRVRVVRVATG